MSHPEGDLLVFSDDWGRHPSSCQHLIRALLGRHHVYWVNTIGTRPPRLDLYTIQRGAVKLASWLRSDSRSDSPVSSNPEILNPLMWPSFRSRFGRGLNVKLIDKSVRRAVSESSNVVAVTTLPIVADLIGVLPVKRWVYYCVDDLSEWPGLDKQSLETMERVLLDKVDDVIAVSDRLVERMAGFGRKATLLTHGVDLDLWPGSSLPIPPAVERLAAPRIIFWGVIDQRLNLQWIERLGQRMTSGSIVLVGPDNTPDSRLARLPRVARVPALPFEELPGVARSASVLIMPYADLPSTQAMQPLKLKEYLATGKPVVISDLPAVSEWRDACDIASSADDFANRVLTRIGQEIPAEQRDARRRLAAESWAGKAAIFEKIVLG